MRNHDERTARSGLRPGAIAPLLLVALAVGFNLWILRAEVLPATYLNDSSIHASMVRWAEHRIREGHLPFDGWYPYLAMGSSRFHHYQSLPHILTAYVSVLLGTHLVYQWSLYLLLSFWPVSVYWGMRLFGWSPWTAALGALVSPLLVSKPGLGYEDGSYVWAGFGTWTQLWGAWMLPLAWGLSWRAVGRRGSYALAALAVGLTIGFHLLTGYLALLTVGVWVVLRPPEILRRARRAAVVIVGSLLVASFMIVPLVLDERVMPQSEISRGTIYYDSFGAKQILAWLFTGQIFDRGRMAIITGLALLGVLVCLVRFRREERAWAVLGAGLLSLLLFFGRPTLGPLLNLLPGSSDLFLRRFIMGVHLAGIYLAGITLATVGEWLYHRLIEGRLLLRSGAAVVMLAVITFVGLSPAWYERASYGARASALLHSQLATDAHSGARFTALVHEAERMGPGRIYAGKRGGDGQFYKIGQVQAYAYLLDLQADGVGFTRPAWSLSSSIEVRFDDFTPAEYRVFAIHYLIWPKGMQPHVPATFVDRRGNHTLWTVGNGGYVGVVDTTAPVQADRTDIGAVMTPFLSSDLLRDGRYPTVAFPGAPGARPTIASFAKPPSGSPGRVLHESDDPADGVFRAAVIANRRAMVMLKSSFDNRWQVTVDGEPMPTQMVAPSYVGRTVPAGRHVIRFRYAAFPYYWLLFALAGLTLILLSVGWRVLRATTSSRKLLSSNVDFTAEKTSTRSGVERS